jgi:hypothetical protein
MRRCRGVREFGGAPVSRALAPPGTNANEAAALREKPLEPVDAWV